MIPTVRKLLPWISLLLLGVAGTYAWKSRVTLKAPAGVNEVIPPRPSHSLPRTTASPSQLAFLRDPGQAWQVRVDLLRNRLSSECGEQEIRYLYDLLVVGPDKRELPEHWYIIANDIMIQLATHDSDAERFSANFLSLLHDSKQPLVLRDYAVQYLATWLNPRSSPAVSEQPGTGAKPTPEVAARVLESLVSATIDPKLEQSSIPGTALMMLVDLTRFPGGVDCSKSIATLKPWLTAALQQTSTLSTPIRVSAVQAAGVLAPLEFRPTLRRIAFQGNGQSALRLPAIAAIGQCGEAADLISLREIIAVAPELSYAARDAENSLQAKISSSQGD